MIQEVCPGRHTTHIGSVYDAVSFAALVDAVAHNGPARASRLPDDVCSDKYATGLDEEQTDATLAASLGVLLARLPLVPKVAQEPRVRGWVKRRP